MTMSSRNQTQARQSKKYVVETTSRVNMPLSKLAVELTDLQSILSLAIWLIDTNNRPSACSYFSSRFVNGNSIEKLIVIIVYGL
jgi:hypothetical protein